MVEVARGLERRGGRQAERAAMRASAIARISRIMSAEVEATLAGGEGDVDPARRRERHAADERRR